MKREPEPMDHLDGEILSFDDQEFKLRRWTGDPGRSWIEVYPLDEDGNSIPSISPGKRYCVDTEIDLEARELMASLLYAKA